jgi:mono/diheme cytochrome c family protein
MRSDDPPVHPNPNMDWQPKFQAQERNTLFPDEAAMRKPVSGTVARGLLKDDPIFYTGRTEAGEYVERIPIEVSKSLLQRGQERYDIYCTVCHGKSGDGQGVIMTGNYGYTPAPTYHGERLRNVTDGYLYDVVANGIRNMPGYAQQIPVRDRWAIVAYVRALQLSQNASEEDLPESVLAQIEQGRSANMEGTRTGGASSAQ